MPESNSQWYEDNGATERNAESASRRSFAAVKSEGLIWSIISTCQAVEAMPGTLVHARASARFFGESIPILASEKCTMCQPEAAAKPQSPIIAIAVHKRSPMRIATSNIFRGAFWKSSNLASTRNHSYVAGARAWLCDSNDSSF